MPRTRPRVQAARPAAHFTVAERRAVLLYFLPREKFFCPGESGLTAAPKLSPPVGDRANMSIMQGLLNKIGLENFFTSRLPVRVFLLDDDTLRHQWFVRHFKGDQVDVAADATRAVELLSSNCYDVIFLDHDLLPEHYFAEEFDDERSGYAIARWLAERPDRHAASRIIVHTRNADGALRMVELLRSNGRQAEHIPFTMLAPKIKKLRRGK